MKKFYIIAGIALFVFLALIINHYKAPEAQESITFFPIDPNVTFKSAQTSLTLLNKPEHTLLWKVRSELDRKAYLRQDAGLLYANGRLIGEVRDWKQNTAILEQEKRIKLENNSFVQAITFHQAELHEKNDQIFSSQTMTGDQLYFVYSSTGASQSFKKPVTPEENTIKQQMDERTERMLQLTWNKGILHFSIKLSDYQAMPLSQFNEKAKKSLPGLSKTKTARVIGNLWEGLYKNYLLGIKKADGTIETPKGSILPLILLAKDHSHLLVLTETASGEPILLRQQMEEGD